MSNPDDARYCSQCGASFTQREFTEPTVEAVKYAGFWYRFAAYLVDGIILSGAQLIFLPVFFPGVLHRYRILPFIMAFPYSIVSVAIVWLYFALFQSGEWQATIGKKVMGLVVTDYDGQRISFGRATGRYFSKIISGLILCIGFIMIAFTDRKQGLHDMIAETLVMRK
ncbi:hypothetical protein CH333_06140 [candidate division WOR-3 bacterium JGI_Cruoil_03_44_89]|uniref:RDD domain-containing protein n=1 Tax=candidate division WOR-3 bacterium JGI_Cruoil_03_44_89 TaxID=1973748 RepID=A0A235BSQ8_UNCW3|nr:MAG: hypothetical protein CH333_06140 [candidate division WOR-3 bacterium JGI_Cruoil_03_44_89]